MTIKINWGTGIIVAFALFMSFVMFFVFRVQSDHKFDNELVVEEYYKQERNLEAQLAKEQNAAGLEHKVTVDISDEEVIKITFPKEFDCTKITGKVSLYRPSDRRLDFEMPISVSTSYLLIPKRALTDGRWDITINWEYCGKGYINKEILTL